MNKQAQLGSAGELEAVEQFELANISGGVMPVYDEQGKIIRTCTGPVLDLGRLVLGLFRLN